MQEIGALFPFPGFIKRHVFDIQILLSFHHRLAVAKNHFHKSLTQPHHCTRKFHGTVQLTKKWPWPVGIKSVLYHPHDGWSNGKNVKQHIKIGSSPRFMTPQKLALRSFSVRFLIQNIFITLPYPEMTIYGSNAVGIFSQYSIPCVNH